MPRPLNKRRRPKKVRWWSRKNGPKWPEPDLVFILKDGHTFIDEPDKRLVLELLTEGDQVLHIYCDPGLALYVWSKLRDSLDLMPDRLAEYNMARYGFGPD
jgi:hypothetical protein